MGEIVNRHEKMRRRITINGLFYAAVSSASFGFSPLFTILLITAGLTDFDVLSYRWLTAAVVLVIYALIKKKSLRLNSFDEVWKIVVLSLLRAITSFTLLLGYANIASGVATTINFMYPVIVALCMMIFFNEQKSPINFLSILISVLGVYLMASGEGLDVDGGNTTLGLVSSLISAFSFAAYYIFMKKSKADKIESVKFTTWIMMLCAVFFIAAGLITHGRIQIVTEFKPWMSILGLGLWATMVSNFTGVKAVRRIGPTLTSIMGALQPLTAVVLGAVFLDEHLGLMSFAGIVLIMASVTMTVISQRTKSH